MKSQLDGQIKITDKYVFFGDAVGSHTTPEQDYLLARTADRLGKRAINDRMPTGGIRKRVYELGRYGSSIGLDGVKNEHGVSYRYIFEQYGGG